jgi:hypothetical protein
MSKGRAKLGSVAREQENEEKERGQVREQKGIKIQEEGAILSRVAPWNQNSKFRVAIYLNWLQARWADLTWG